MKIWNMKTQQILVTVIVAFIVGTIRTNAQTASTIEMRIGDTVYELETGDVVYESDTVINYTLRNKANKIISQEGNNSIGCQVSFDNYSEEAKTAWKEHFKPIFSKERAEELKLRITLFCICDSTGSIRQVEGIHFRNRENFEKFTLSEIKAIEDAAKTYRYKFFSWRCYEKQKYVLIVHPLSPYLLYFEKPE